MVDLDKIPTVNLASLPTALEKADRLACEIGLECLLVKRDDNTGLALGGNKARKLEYLMAEALVANANVVLTCGGVQSNHVRMTAAAARKMGMDCIIFLPDHKPKRFDGNLLLNSMLGAELRFMPEIRFENLLAEMNAEADRLVFQGRKPYVIPMGGATPLGTLGYVNAVREISFQLKELNIEEADFVTAVGTGGTAAGLSLGCQLFFPGARTIGVSVLFQADKISEDIKHKAVGAAELLGTEYKNDAIVYDEYIGERYAIPTEEGMAAIFLAARTEGLILDPVYTGKAMAGLIDLARKGVIGKDRPVVFWHTGGAPALFAYEALFRVDAQ